MEEDFFRKCVYRGPDELLQDAQKKGLIECDEQQENILQKILPEKDIRHSLKIRILNIKGWITFLKDVNLRTKNDEEYRFTDGLLVMFEEVVDITNKPECAEYLNIKQEKKQISDEDIIELKKINYLEELLDPKNGFFK